MFKNPWLTILFAIFFETGWVVGIKYANTWWEWLLTIAALVTSFTCYILASRKLPIGTTYAVFVGLGAAATVVVGWLFFGEALTPLQGLFLITLLAGVMGLKLVEDEA